MPDFAFRTREYQPSDLPQMLDLVRELEDELARTFKDVTIKTGVDEYAEHYLQPATKYKTFVAESDGRLIGYLIGYPSVGAPEVDNMFDIVPVSPGWTPPEFYIQMTFVSPSYRNKGVSKALHRLIIDYAKAQGHKEIYAVIAKWNIAEISVVSSFGFKMTDLGYRYRFWLKF
jgi:GNAT superfamily N-acetyltransferase